MDSNGQPEPYWVEERAFMEKTQTFGKTLYYQGDLSYFESVNMETLKNGFHRLNDYGILMIQKPTNNKERTKVALHPDFVPSRGPDGRVRPEGTLWDMVERIGTFRREGKNRRDNATGKHAQLFMHEGDCRTKISAYTFSHFLSFLFLTVSSRVLRFAEVVANAPAPVKVPLPNPAPKRIGDGTPKL